MRPLQLGQRLHSGNECVEVRFSTMSSYEGLRSPKHVESFPRWRLRTNAYAVCKMFAATTPCSSLNRFSRLSLPTCNSMLPTFLWSSLPGPRFGTWHGSRPSRYLLQCRIVAWSMTGCALVSYQFASTMPLRLFQRTTSEFFLFAVDIHSYL